MMNNSLVWSTEPSPSDWADSLIPTALEMSDDAIGIANKGSVVEWKTAHWTPPGPGEEEGKKINKCSLNHYFFKKNR